MLNYPTPQAIVAELDKYIIGQAQAKRAVAVALRNRFRRMQLSEDLRAEITPKNIMMIGPTGVGKTEIARRIARLARAPFVKVEVTKFTQVGYVGRDVDSIIRDLADTAIGIVQEDKEREVMGQAEERAQERLLRYLLSPRTAREIEAELNGEPLPPDETPIEDTPEPVPVRGRGKKAAMMSTSAASAGNGSAPKAQTQARRESSIRARSRKKRIAEALANQQLEERLIDIEIESDDTIGNMLEYMTTISSDDSGEIMQEFLTPNFGSGRKRTRRLPVREARRILVREEAQKLIDSDQVIEEATRRVEQNGIVFLDEIDKIVGSRIDMGPDVSGEGVQRDLLPIVEGTTVMTRYGPVKTDHVLWIAAGAFHKHKPSDLIPELQGRFPLRVELESLSEADFKSILIKTEHSLTRQYAELLKTEEVQIVFTEEGISSMAHYAYQMNERTENIGARRLHTIVEKVLEDLSFAAPDLAGQEIVIDANYVATRLDPIVTSEDMSRYIL
jgi:ATP-dependent HslUV protease ATP-binding subunit HslU